MGVVIEFDNTGCGRDYLSPRNSSRIASRLRSSGVESPERHERAQEPSGLVSLYAINLRNTTFILEGRQSALARVSHLRVP